MGNLVPWTQDSDGNTHSVRGTREMVTWEDIKNFGATSFLLPGVKWRSWGSLLTPAHFSHFTCENFQNKITFYFICSHDSSVS